MYVGENAGMVGSVSVMCERVVVALTGNILFPPDSCDHMTGNTLRGISLDIIIMQCTC